jgi:hypothetical protein
VDRLRSSMVLPEPDIVQRYFEQLDLPSHEASSQHRAALARAHELRKFEIENYWKRSAYFWGFQLVSFAALALSAKEGRFYPPIVLLVAVLGALAALTGVLTAKGSKFWQANWEAHVDFLETAVEGRLHTTALVEDKLSYSVSRVNERFLEVLLAGWMLVFVAAATVLVFPGLKELKPCAAAAVQIAIPLVAFFAGAWWIVVGQESKLRGRAFRRSTMAPW